jgi:soluble cytochrome b562
MTNPTLNSILLVLLAVSPAVAVSPSPASTPTPAASPSATMSTAPSAPASTAPPAAPRPTVEGKKGTVPLSIEQIRLNLPAATAERFEFLRRQRKITLEAIDETTSQLRTLTNNLSLLQRRRDGLDNVQAFDFPVEVKERTPAELQQAKAELEDIQKQLDNAKKGSPPNQELVRKFENGVRYQERVIMELDDTIKKQEQSRKDEAKRAADFEMAKKSLDDELSRLNDEKDRVSDLLLAYQRLLGELDDMVNQLFIANDATNSFKLKMSMYLSLVIAIVIVGFFAIAWSDVEVKRKIFSNEAGIQFITLFAIVISVILFGIIGVLESKELSALLGGLSGYILGRKSA